ncbi:hypothetical protein BP5796_02636 [Coleophoma crateriformis]|uniref:Uncharacterized protein n=1 Tax=Coleophoma crateriformis TaxID=565419 RepID=A0A3D8SZ78_9HELO|nr:hypothetical protein BP5796_02636 [Coleophoma crateriformis]
MDEAYNQHSRRNRSSANLNHLTLAPLTSKLPLTDQDDLPQPQHHVSYIEGRSAPTTPSVLSRSSSRVSLLKPSGSGLPKSKSSTHLLTARKQQRSGATTLGGTKPRRGVNREDLTLSPTGRSDSDWLLRTSALISSSTQESKGQSWLVSRASSTSLQRDADEEELERELAREREHANGLGSRRGSMAGDADDEFSPVTTRRSFSFGPGTRPFSQPPSRFGSRSGSRAQLFTPLERNQSGYFDPKHMALETVPVEPDFVNAEEEALEEAEKERDDEDVVKKLARANSLGLSGWVERMLGWHLFSVDEDGEETEAEGDGRTEEHESISRSSSQRHLELESIPHTPFEEKMPALKPDEGGWQDAAWLLSVATKVLL